MLGYEPEKYSDDEDADGTNHVEDADGTNHSDLKIVKRGITRLYKFRMEYGKPGDLVLEHIGLKILSWKKVDKESRDKLWDEITRYFDVDLTVQKQATDERIELLKTQLDNERHERLQKDVLVKKLSIDMTEKYVLVKKLSNEMTETKGMLSQLMNQLAAQGV
nr:hypothetical protein [Tanacetum cinerariifolium]